MNRPAKFSFFYFLKKVNKKITLWISQACVFVIKVILMDSGRLNGAKNEVDEKERLMNS